MKIQLVRNATLLLDYGNKRFLMDPMLVPKAAYPGFSGTANSHLSNPLVDLRVSRDEKNNVDAVIVTHTHPDHGDDVAKSILPKELLIIVQDEKDEAEIREAGFNNTQVLMEITEYDGVKISQTLGQHGSNHAVSLLPDLLGRAC